MSRPSPAQRQLLRECAKGRRRAPGALRRLFPPYTVAALERRGLIQAAGRHLALTDAGVAALEDGDDRRAQQVARRARRAA